MENKETKINLTSFEERNKNLKNTKINEKIDEKNKIIKKNNEKNLSNEEFDEKINDVLLKRAMGYCSEEIIEEFQEDNGDMKLIKRKVTKKDIPPDINAVKILLDKYNIEELDFSKLTDEELEKLRNEVIFNLVQEFDNTITDF